MAAQPFNWAHDFVLNVHPVYYRDQWFHYFHLNVKYRSGKISVLGKLSISHIEYRYGKYRYEISIYQEENIDMFDIDITSLGHGWCRVLNFSDI